MKFLSPLPGLEILLDVFPQLSLWATIVRHSVAKMRQALSEISLRLCASVAKIKP
jgi:hypothetical protein